MHNVVKTHSSISIAPVQSWGGSLVISFNIESNSVMLMYETESMYEEFDEER
jgi:hypothetical protein